MSVMQELRNQEAERNVLKLRAGHKNPFRLSPLMEQALIDAVVSGNHEVIGVERRTKFALVDRGLASIHRGRGSNRYGETIYDAIRAFPLTDAGLEAGRILAERKGLL